MNGTTMMNRTATKRLPVLLLALAALSLPSVSQGQDDEEALKMAALEALVSAPEERALPIVQKVLASDDSVVIKRRALFVLSQIDLPEAVDTLIATASGADPELATEAIRMIAINGDPAAMDRLGELYASGSPALREAVFEAYIIADDVDAVYRIAANAQSEAEFARAVDTLGAMGAIEELRALRDVTGYSERLIQALSIASDLETLAELASDGSDPRRQVQAIKAMGIVGGEEADTMLVDIYRNAGNTPVRQAALNGLLISGYDEGVLELYREAEDAEEKKQLLQILAAMGSDGVWDAIDAALTGNGE